ncbi:MAG: hypothetical protein FGM15_12685 [Chthoniobacterales bacterium]|nr:hypothetical protein [Chthoniobacterales bacterium]
MGWAKNQSIAQDDRRNALINLAEGGDQNAKADLWKEFGVEIDPRCELDADAFEALSHALEKED